jgi:hypothetical protein
MAADGVQLYVGGDAQNLQHRRFNLTGRRCFSASYGPGSKFTADEAATCVGLLDSGAFSDPPQRRLTPDSALDRQLAWEARARARWGLPWVAEALVSYDLLIDEVWTGRARHKRRWSVTEADRAVRVTVDAAAYLAGRREQLLPRRVVLAAQGVDWRQYAECAAGVLEHARPGDWFGLGGWCILGSHRTWLPQFWATIRAVLPTIEAAGLTRLHIFGVLWEPALGRLLWLADRHGLAVSTDSSGPALAVAWKDYKRAGVLARTWEENVRLWRERLANLRSSPHYREPPAVAPARQTMLY